MVSFSCEGCGDVLTKKKLDSHRAQCRGASFTCLDCMVHFQGSDYRSHTSCISEAQKYQGTLYKPQKVRKSKSVPHTPRRAYVEDEPEDDERHSRVVIVEPPLPPAPSPPSATSQRELGEAVNVFDFLVDNETPNASRVELQAPEPINMLENVQESRVTKQPKSQDSMRVRSDRAGYSRESFSQMVEYGSGPIPNGKYYTPAPKQDHERKKEKRDRDGREEQKDKKRKRLHLETSQDEIMTDAPPILHSGLSGGLKNLLSRPSIFPPTPDFSGGDPADDVPGSPLKKPKHSSRRSHMDNISNNVVSLITPSGLSSREDSTETRRRRKHRRHDRASPPNQMVAYHPPPSHRSGVHLQSENSNDVHDDAHAQMVLYRPRAETLLELVNKGPESERGVSMNKALKRYHRERSALGGSLGKGDEEKELWRCLRMKRNDRGEVVLFL